MSSASSKSGRSANTDPRDPRSAGRELALLALCHLESYPPDEYVEALAILWRAAPRGDEPRGRAFSKMVADDEVRRRADGLVQGLIGRWAEVDETISETSRRWRLERMAQVDRNVLRLAAFELGHRPNTPRPVVLAEAVRLARRYGSERSPSFVNGVAEALAQRIRGGGSSKAAKAGADG